MPVTNPLLHAAFRIPFDQIRAEHVEPAIGELIVRAQAKLDAIAEAGPRTREVTLEGYDRATSDLDYAVSIVRHLEGAATTPELRAAYNAVQAEIGQFYASIPLHGGLYAALKEFAATPEAATLDPVRKRFLDKTIDTFRRHGAELDAAGKKMLEEIDVELAKLTTKFSENVLDATNAFELIVTDETKLAGLPESAVEAARESAKQKGAEGWRFTLQGPSYLAVMTYLDDREIRERLYREYNSRASSGPLDNRGIVLRILKLRGEKARLLGFESFADFVLCDRMAKSAARAREFLAEMRGKTESHFARENAELRAFQEKTAGPGAAAIEPWDIGYYSEKMRQALYDFDEEELRPYFPAESVVDGMLRLFGGLFDINVRERKDVPGWDSAVRYFEIRDASGMIGAFYCDLFPRENKRGGAWMDSFITGVMEDGQLTPHLGLICGNMTPPVGGKPALLTHREVETVFHEFGHLLHHCLSTVEVRSLSGTSVAWDFVELPSQIMENWCWEREALDLFARHYQTGERIPADLFDKLKRARNFRSANGQIRQVSFGYLDFALHNDYSPDRDGGLFAYCRTVLKPFCAAPLPECHAIAAAFTHLFASPVGYGAGYYSYKWAEVLDADAFTRFREQGIFNQAVGRAYRDHILSRGDSDDPALLYRNFVGRDPDPSALLVRCGLA